MKTHNESSEEMRFQEEMKVLVKDLILNVMLGEEIKFNGGRGKLVTFSYLR